LGSRNCKALAIFLEAVSLGLINWSTFQQHNVCRGGDGSS
jgi:hypothetical protein